MVINCEDNILKIKIHLITTVHGNVPNNVPTSNQNPKNVTWFQTKWIVPIFLLNQQVICM